MRGGIPVSTPGEETCQVERLGVDVERKPSQLTLGTLGNPHISRTKNNPTVIKI